MQRVTLAALLAGLLIGWLAGATLPALPAQGNRPGMPGFTYGDLKEVKLRGYLVSLPEWLGKAYGANDRGVAGKHYGLRLIDGTLYTFFPNYRYQELIEGDRWKDRPIEVEARHFPRSQILEILSVRPLPADALRAEYYCKVCDITAYVPGPCVCCGQEVELVAPRP